MLYLYKIINKWTSYNYYDNIRFNINNYFLLITNYYISILFIILLFHQWFEKQGTLI